MFPITTSFAFSRSPGLTCSLSTYRLLSHWLRLIAAATGDIEYSYSLGDVTTADTPVGGSIGTQNATSIINQVYEAGAATSSHSSPCIGAFIGDNVSGSSITLGVYDSTHNSTLNATGSCGAADSNIVGETNHDLTHGLPTGFDTGIWAQSGSIQGGYPYLIANPPQ